MDNLTNLTSQLCVISRTFIETPGLTYFLILMIIVGVCSLIPNLLLFLAVWKVTLFHWNLRILFAHLSFVCMFYSIALVLKTISLVNIAFNGQFCRLIIDANTCRLQELCRSWPAQLIMYCCTAITIERLYCTVRYKKPYQGFPWLALVLIPLCYLVPLINSLRSSSYSNNQLVPVCEVLLSININAAKSGLGINASMTIVSLMMVIWLHYWNHSQLRSMLGNRAMKHTLSARFQLDQNVQLTKIIGPSAILEFFCFVPTSVFLLLVIVGLPLTYELKTIMIQCQYFWKLCFTLAYPILAFARNAQLRKGLSKTMPTFLRKMMAAKKVGQETKTTKVTVIMPKGMHHASHGKTHFELLDASWKSGKK